VESSWSQLRQKLKLVMGSTVGSQSLLVSASYPSHELMFSADRMRDLKV
jgi:hypothetical protein